MHSTSLPTVLVVENSPDDELLTLRVLRRLEIPMRIEIEHDADSALVRMGLGSVFPLPHLTLISDGLRPLDAAALVQGVRELHPQEAASLVHLLASEDSPHAVGADAWLVKPLGYEEYMADLSAVVRHWLAA
jgi:DNA-binding response OmpR family regulator